MSNIFLPGKLILITGAAHGLGRELAYILDRIGCSLLLLDRDSQGLSSFSNNLTRQHEIIVCNLNDIQEIRKTIESIKKDKKVDILINCAGIGSHSSIKALTIDEIQRVMQVNALAPIELTAGLSPLEFIVNIGSVAGEMNLPFMSLYSASKASLHAFSRSLQLEGIHTLLVIYGPLRGTDFVQSIEHPHTSQPKWYRKLDLDVELAAYKIVRAIEKRRNELVLPGWYRIIFIIFSLFMPLLRIFSRKRNTEFL
jgi:uncharacterized protein